MRIFITGSTGFIGRRVVADLQKRKHSVYCMKSRLEKIRGVEQELKRYAPDVVLHLAWEGLPDYGAAMSAKNIATGMQFFMLLAKCKLKKVVAVGTCFEYDNEKTASYWAYILAKRALRQFGEKLFSDNGGMFVWAVPFYVYGAGKPPRSLIPALIAQAKSGKVPVVKNDVWLDYVYVDDVARALVILVEKRRAQGTYEVGTGTHTRTGDIARIIARAYGVPSVSLPPMSKSGKVADTRRVRNLGWKPTHSMHKGISAMIV